MKMRTVVLNDRGQIVIPEELRKDLDLKAGQTLVLVEVGDELLLRKEESVVSDLDDRRFWRAMSQHAFYTGWDKEDEVWDQYAPKRNSTDGSPVD